MLAYALHILQPLNVGCFLLLKRAYGTEISRLIYHYINYINKLSFLSAFKTAFKKVIIKDNIHAGFRATGLILFKPDIVLL
jgi:hypothetical protein